MIAYNPLAGGMLTGRYRGMREVQQGTRFALQGAGEVYRKRYWNEEVFDVVDHLDTFVEERGKKLVHVALAGCWRNRVSPAPFSGQAVLSSCARVWAASVSRWTMRCGQPVMLPGIACHGSAIHRSRVAKLAAAGGCRSSGDHACKRWI